jgi:hypothetical protein
MRPKRRYPTDLLAAVLLAAGLACGGRTQSGAASQPSATDARQSTEARQDAMANVIVTSYRWVMTHTPGMEQVAFWTTLYGHAESRCVLGTCSNQPISGPAYAVHSQLDRQTTDSLGQRLQRELNLVPLDKGAIPNCTRDGCHFGDFQALLSLTNLDLRGDTASAVVSTFFDATVVRRFGVLQNDVCLKLARESTSWSVVGAHPWIAGLAPTSQNVCR